MENVTKRTKINTEITSMLSKEILQDRFKTWSDKQENIQLVLKKRKRKRRSTWHLIYRSQNTGVEILFP